MHSYGRHCRSGADEDHPTSHLDGDGDCRPIAQSTAEPAPTPAIPEALDPWILSFSGLGPFRLGEDSTAELTVAGFRPDGDAGCVALYRWSSGDPDETNQQEYDVTVALEGVREVYAFTTAQSPDGNWRTDDRAPRTDVSLSAGDSVDGVTFGDSMDKVRIVYPDIRRDIDYGGYREYISGPHNGNYVRIVTTGSITPVETVTGLRTATYPEWAPPGC